MTSEITPLELARKLISFRTFLPEGSERKCAEYLAGLLQAAGFDISLHEFEPDRTTLLAELPPDGEEQRPPICLAGHMDTVPLGATEWQHDPYGGEVDGDRLYGRGVTDMKAGVAAAAIAGIRAAGLKGRSAVVKLVFTAGEELGCKGSLHLANESGALGEAGALIVAEPTSNHPVCCHRGALWLRVSATGETAHGALPHLGDNAIYKVAKMISAAEAYRFDIAEHELLGNASINVGMVEGGQNINSVPDQAAFTMDIRTLPGQENQPIVEELQRVFGDGASIEKLVNLEAVETDPRHPWMLKVRSVAEQILGQELPPKGKLAFTDAGALTPGFGHCPTVIMGPGIQEQCHKTDEHCLVSKIDEAVVIYEELIVDWIQSTNG